MDFCICGFVMQVFCFLSATIMNVQADDESSVLLGFFSLMTWKVFPVAKLHQT